MGTNKFYKKKKKSYKDRARLLTEAEKKVILDGYDNVSKKDLMILVIISFIAFAIFIALLGIQKGLIMITFTSVVIVSYFATLRKVVKRVRANEMYAVDAVYDHQTVGKFRHVYLKSYKKPYDGYDLLVREPLKKGDRVIVLQMRGKAWVYKARN